MTMPTNPFNHSNNLINTHKLDTDKVDKNWQQQPIRQAMILAAGKGTRMRPLTLTTPKPLINVGGKALIEWHINALKQAGIIDIVINASWLADKLQEGIGDGSHYGVNIHWSIEEQPLETAAGIAKALYDNKLKQTPFLLINGDVWTRYPLDKMGQSNNTDMNDSDMMNTGLSDVKTLVHLLLVANPEHNRAGDFVFDDGKAFLKSDNPLNEQQTWTFAGISLMHPALFVDVPYDRPYPLVSVLQQAMATHQVSAEVYDGVWVDVGTPERLAWVDQYIRSNF